MPELPEVETTLRGIEPHIQGQLITNVILRRPDLRFPLPIDLESIITGQHIVSLSRRAKYLLLHLETGTLILHLGMSGKLKIISRNYQPSKHDHVDIWFKNGKGLTFNDPRRFGALLWTETAPEQHPLLASLGPEPLTKAFNGIYLWQRAQGRKTSIKNFIMDSHTVAGVGNIYAAEALFLAGIRPQKAAGKVTRDDYDQLADAIKKILKQAIKKGGTTLRDFLDPNGATGYFSIELNVYGRGGEPCFQCGRRLKSDVIGQRSTVYCAHCQR
jgi:formamidopyrimidine-DNA glycosylase